MITIQEITPLRRAYFENKMYLAGQEFAGELDFPVTAAQFSERMSFSPESSARFLRALTAFGWLDFNPRTNYFSKSSAFSIKPPFAFCDDRARPLFNWFDLGPVGLEGLRTIIDLDQNVLRLNEVPGFQDPSLVFEAGVLVMLLYSRLITSRFFSIKNIERTLQQGCCQTSHALAVSNNQIFDQYRHSQLLMEVFSESFARANYLPNCELVRKVSINNGDKILDVGGGVGSLARAVFEQNPGVSIDIYDHPDSQPIMERIGRSWINPLEVRLKRFYGDFFEGEEVGLPGLSLTQKYSHIFLGWVLHDWDDEKCIRILKRVSKHLAAEGRILILERIKTEDISFVDSIDFLMLVMANGKERTVREYSQLFKEAGLEFEKKIDQSPQRSALIVRKL